MPVADLLIRDILLGVGLPLATFALGTAMAGFAGVLVAPVFAIDPQLGSRFIIKAFAVIIVGGMAVIPARSIAALVESYNHGNGVNLLALVVAVICCSSNQAMHFHRVSLSKRWSPRISALRQKLPSSQRRSSTPTPPTLCPNCLKADNICWAPIDSGRGSRS